MNLRMMAFAAVALTAVASSAVSFAQTPPGPQGTPPPPPVPNTTSSPLISSSAQPTAVPSETAMPVGMTPTPVPFTSPTAAPTESPTESGRHRGRKSSAATPEPSPSDTPEPPQFSTLDGVWEVAMQPLNGARTVYSHLYVTQTGNTLSGTWRRTGKEVLPFTGTFDGRLFKLTFTVGTATELLSGYEENYSDIVGLYTDGDPKHEGTPFTAAHRKRARDSDRDTPPKVK